MASACRQKPPVIIGICGGIATVWRGVGKRRVRATLDEIDQIQHLARMLESRHSFDSLGRCRVRRGERLDQVRAVIAKHGHCDSGLLSEASGMTRTEAGRYLHKCKKQRSLVFLGAGKFVMPTGVET